MNRHFIEGKYRVDFDDFSNKNYIEDFERKYKNNWAPTKQSISDSLERICNLDGTSCVDCICKTCNGTWLVKYDFKVAKTNKSAKTSGNRCILNVNNEDRIVNILLVYCKDHINRPLHQETVWWKEIIFNNFGLKCA